MTRDEAEEMCARLAAEHPDRETHRWRPRETGDGEWEVVKIALPPSDATTPEIEAAERPPTADDPRPSLHRNVPPFGAA